MAGYTGSHGLANGLPMLIETARVLQERAVGNIALVFVGDGQPRQSASDWRQTTP